MEQQIVEKEFVERTLHILQNYEGPYGVTLLINCLLGMIILPKEKDFNHISGSEDIHFSDLGIEDGDIKSWGKIEVEGRTAARFIRSMRNSIAHIRIESISNEGEIESLHFTDKSGFEAVLSIEKIKQMVMKLREFVR